MDQPQTNLKLKYDPLPDDLPSRIQAIYDSCCREDQEVLLTILQELSDTGDSKTYRGLWLSDFKEIPVDKKTFLTSPEFLGNSNNCGASIYPAWMEVMEDLERSGNQYYEIVFTGATRTGKTSTAVSDGCYQLYWIMCLRSPQEFFSLKSVTRISFFFFNLTESLAKGVAYKEFISTLYVSPWFQQHGTFTGTEANRGYMPEGGLIEITYGSAASHALGKATFCLVGSTRVLTKDGPVKIEDLDGNCSVAQYDSEQGIIYVPAEVRETKKVTETVRITLEDGSVIEGTPDHRIMLADGNYVELQDLVEGDDIKNL